MKRMYVVLSALLLAITFSAFTGKSSAQDTDNKPPSLYWFKLSAGGTASDPNAYSNGTLLPPTDCGEVQLTRCAVQAEMQGASDPQPNKPKLTTIAQEIKRAS